MTVRGSIGATAVGVAIVGDGTGIAAGVATVVTAGVNTAPILSTSAMIGATLAATLGDNVITPASINCVPVLISLMVLVSGGNGE